MTNFWSLMGLALLAGGAIASPVDVAAPAVTAAPEAAVALNKRATCTFSGANGAASASAAQKSCPTMVLSNVAVPAGTTLDLSSLADGTHVIFEGTTTWGYKAWAGPLMQISGKSITVTGASGAILNPDGARWWDGKGTAGTTTKPKFFYAHGLTNSNINNLHIMNTPLMAVSINGASGLNITDMTIDSSAGDTKGGHNTDGFDISDSTNVIITGAKVYNQDDCVAINSGTGITFTGGLCSGGHGLSIGSVGGRSNNVVKNVKFLNSQVTKSVQAIRIKTVSGATGSVSGVTYSGITMSSISKYGIIIEQNYNGSDLGGTATSGVPITGLTISNIVGTGSVASSGYNIVLVCGSTGCSNWTWSKVAVTGGKNYGSCSNYPSVATCSA